MQAQYFHEARMFSDVHKCRTVLVRHFNIWNKYVLNYKKDFLGLFLGCQTSSKPFNMRAPPVTLAETLFVGVHVAKQPLDSRSPENAAVFQVKAGYSTRKAADLLVNWNSVYFRQKLWFLTSYVH